MKQSQAKKHDNTMTNKILMRLIALVLGLLFLEILIIHSKNEQQKSVSNQVQTARIMANGDLLYHDDRVRFFLCYIIWFSRRACVEHVLFLS